MAISSVKSQSLPQSIKGDSEPTSILHANHLEIDRPETRVVLACSRAHLDAEDINRIGNLLTEDLDWVETIRVAQVNRVLPLLSYNLMHYFAEALPKSILEQLKTYYRIHSSNCLYLTGELTKLLRLLESMNIPALPFKGPVLASTVYGNLSLRRYGDLDILIRKKDLEQVRGLLMSQGYELGFKLNWYQRISTYVDRKKDFCFTRNDGKVRVEIHWLLSGKHFAFHLDQNRYWERFDKVSLAGTPVRNFPPIDLLLYLCVHGSRHGWVRLSWICDVSELVRSNPDLDWNMAMSQTQLTGDQRSLALGLFLAHDLLQAPIPQEVLQKIQTDPEIRLLASHVKDVLLSDGESTSDLTSWRDYHLKMKKRFRDQARLLVHYYLRYARIAVVPNAQDKKFLSLPRPLGFLYYPVRQVRLARDYWWRPWKQAVKRFTKL